MFDKNSTNADIVQHDWARRDRATLLHSLHAGRAPRTPAAPSSGWGTDVASTDRRSVRAYLSGKGDLRTTWWHLYSSLYLAVVPGSLLEDAMFSFHSLHHSLTLAGMSFVDAVARTASDIEYIGVIAAAKRSFVREKG